MPYRIEAFPDEGYILLEHYGEISVAEVDAARLDVMEQVVKHAMTAILVSVIGVTNKLSTFDAFYVTESHGKIKHPNMRGALLARSDQMADAKFMETVARNRGMNIWAFADKEEALAWLRG